MYRFIYIVWRVFWSGFLVLLLTLSLFSAAVFLLLQTEPVKNYLSDQVEFWFNERFEGTISIGELGGLLPMQMELKQVELHYKDEIPVSFESLSLSVELLALLRNHLSIRDISLNNPEIHLTKGASGRYTLSEAFQFKHPESDDEFLQTQTIRTIDIYAPFVQIFNGKVRIEDYPEGRDWSPLPSPILVENINTEMYLDFSSRSRFLDITYLTLTSSDFPGSELTLSGQVYNDSRYLEFNAMQLGFGNSWAEWSSEFTGINLLDDNLSGQLRDAYFQVILEDLYLASSERDMLFPSVPGELADNRFSLTASGHRDILQITNADFRTGNSLVRFDAELENFSQPELISYNFDIAEFRLGNEELWLFLPATYPVPPVDWSVFESGGKLKGTRNSLEADMAMNLPEGSLSVKGNGTISDPVSTNLFISIRDVDLSAIAYEQNPDTDRNKLPATRINSEIHLTGADLTGPESEWVIDLDMFGSRIGDFLIPDLQLDATYASDIIRHEFEYLQNENYLTGRGRFDLSRQVPHMVVSGRSSGIDLQKMAGYDFLPGTDWNMNYDINWHGRQPEEWFGRIIVDVLPSRVNDSDLRSHQMYLDLNRPDSPERSLRLTSTFLDLLASGEFELSSANNLYEHWKHYFSQRIHEELLFDEVDTVVTGTTLEEDVLNAEIVLELKDMKLLRAYLPQLPELQSDALLVATIGSDRENLNVDIRWNDSHTDWNGITLDNSQMSLTTGFRYNQWFRSHLDMDIDISADRVVYNDFELESVSWNVHVENDRITSRNSFENSGNNITFSSNIEALLTDSLIYSEINELKFGDNRYLWESEGIPVIRYTDDGRLHIDDFRLVSGTDRIFVNGIFSSHPDDSVNYNFADVDLRRFSQIIDGRIDFDGVLTADLVTKTLTEQPFVHGNVKVDRLVFDDRIIGDIELSSLFNPELQRFETSFEVVTDTTRYADYLAGNNGKRQDISAKGWLRFPEAGEAIDSMYHFDVDAKEVDLWVLIYLLDGIFTDVEGRGTGRGYLTGNLNHIDFNGDFEILESAVTPVFFDTNYELLGEVSVSRSGGVQLHDVHVHDFRNGTGVLSGNYDFNEFQAERFMNMTLQMDNLLFMDNSDGPDNPFFGSVAGTGTVNISGSNISPFVRTPEPIRTTSQSRLSIPLAGPGTGDQRGRYIRFVRDFHEYEWQRQIVADPEVLREVDRSFMEIFRLDLQFIAAPNSTMQLIFDPVTGEIVNARGSGRVRVLLEDEDLQMFGNFQISDGDYLFVGGDILTRRFILRDGGTIRWDGDPANAILDITAVYRARPNIAPLMGATTEQTNRIPVELLLEITGPLESIENDFYFDIPTAIDAAEYAAVLNVLNSEEQKLMQATSLLFTGGFISGAMVGDTQTQELGTALQTRAGQAGIGQLLSSQINTLLSDNLINLDVDLNLFGFDQADLGIALRLFDDRLVLRREGEVGGEEAYIGDLGATYRISQNLSVEVFHRKDPMLMSILGTQAEVENVNGVGVEAQFRFNTWRELAGNVWRNVTTLFGLLSGNDDDGDQEGVANAASTNE